MKLDNPKKNGPDIFDVGAVPRDGLEDPSWGRSCVSSAGPNLVAVARRPDISVV